MADLQGTAGTSPLAWGRRVDQTTRQTYKLMLTGETNLLGATKGFAWGMGHRVRMSYADVHGSWHLFRCLVEAFVCNGDRPTQRESLTH